MPLSRRAFLGTCSAAAAAAFWKQSRAGENDLPGPLIEQKRKVIREVMAKHDIPGAAADGEAFALGGTRPTWRNIPLERVP